MAKTTIKNRGPEQGIDLRDIGPVRKLHLETPAEGGVVVLRGRNGSGKTTSLQAVESLVGGSGSLSVRDRALDGEVAGFGGIVKVARSTRHLGELEVTGLEGRLSLGDLVDPGQKDPAAADARRIKALVRLSGRKIDASAFTDLFESNGEAQRILGSVLEKLDDPVEMAERAKREIESEARRLEHQAEAEEADAKTASGAIADVDLSAADALDNRREVLERTIKAKAKQESERETGLAAESSALEARDELAEYEAGPRGATLAEATDRREAAAKELGDANAEVDRLRDELAAAKQTVEQKRVALESADEAVVAAKEREELVARWRQTAGNVPAYPSAEDIAQAGRLVETARDSVTEAEIANRAKGKKAEADQLAARAAGTRAESDRLREIARSTEGLLSEIVAGLGNVDLRVRAGRLVTKTDRGDTFFAELSHGERWKLSLDLAVDVARAAADENGRYPILVAPQECWEGLDGLNRRAVAERLAGTGVVLITAEPSIEELHAEVFAPEPVGAGA